MTDLQRITTRVDGHSAARWQLQERAEARVLRLVSGFDGWYDHPAISQMAAEGVRYVQASQRGVAVATDSYLAQVATEIVGRTIRPVGTVDTSTLRQGVTHEGAYGRLADDYRFRVASGQGPDEVMAAILARARAMVATDIALAFTHQSRRTLARILRVEGYRRIVRPELAKKGACGLCLVASDRFYLRGDLLPLHAGCNCAVLPIIGDDDPGRLLNRSELDRLYDDAGSTRRDDLIKVRYEVRMNGEIGPVLTNADHAHRGPGDL